mmetsp:Transcript_25084/g.58367  ORF Transcript_25084/g.58367 Transcript_25084/m.58367 type:complete len:253 (-) Transcript_25084:90-848(-)
MLLVVAELGRVRADSGRERGPRQLADFCDCARGCPTVLSSAASGESLRSMAGRACIRTTSCSSSGGGEVPRLQGERLRLRPQLRHLVTAAENSSGNAVHTRLLTKCSMRTTFESHLLCCWSKLHCRWSMLETCCKTASRSLCHWPKLSSICLSFIDSTSLICSANASRRLVAQALPADMSSRVPRISFPTLSLRLPWSSSTCWNLRSISESQTSSAADSLFTASVVSDLAALLASSQALCSCSDSAVFAPLS